MKKEVIVIDENKCNGCGACASACHMGAIGMVDGKARLLREDYCDGLGRCLPVCPTGAISFKEQEEKPKATDIPLNQWPVQIKLVPVNAPYFDNANLLVAADCAAYAYGRFHDDFMRNRITIIGCPKLDEGDYSEKLTAILTQNNIKSVAIARIEVPCCSGIENAAKTALKNCDKLIPWQVITISTDGKILEN
ncbi:MAG: 4Fe-4S binding protein [Defluviitaleaceae bacterium]|nr:4Fe-4S binding protein [Defluviitaleaceae bacterium]